MRTQVRHHREEGFLGVIQTFMVALLSVVLAVVCRTTAFIVRPYTGQLSPTAGQTSSSSGTTPPCVATTVAATTRMWAESSQGGEGGGKKKKKRRVRRDQPQAVRSADKPVVAEEGEQQSSTSSPSQAAAPIPPPPRTPEDIAARTEAEASQKKFVDDVIARDFDRILMQDEFVDVSEIGAGDEEGEGEEGGEEEEGGGGGGLSDKFKFDPDFDLPIKSEGTMDLSDIKMPASPFDPTAKPDASILLPKSLVEVGKKVKQKNAKTRGSKKEATKRLFGFEPEVMAKELEPIDDYDLTSGFLGDSRDVMGVGLPFLQSSHTVWLLVALLCAFVEFPGFPLTTLPTEIRSFLKTGLAVVYVINAVLAYDSIKLASARGQNVPFWIVKTFFLGALAHNELHLIREKKSGNV